MVDNSSEYQNVLTTYFNEKLSRVSGLEQWQVGKMTTVVQVSKKDLTRHCFETKLKCKVKYICSNCKASWTSEMGWIKFSYDPYVLIEPAEDGENTLVGANL